MVNRKSPSGTSMEPVNPKNIDTVEKETLEHANKALSALEIAIASWESTEPKPEELADKFTKYRRLHGALSEWEKKMLMARRRKEEFDARVARLQDFVRICRYYG